MRMTLAAMLTLALSCPALANEFGPESVVTWGSARPSQGNPGPCPAPEAVIFELGSAPQYQYAVVKDDFASADQYKLAAELVIDSYLFGTPVQGRYEITSDPCLGGLRHVTVLIATQVPK